MKINFPPFKVTEVAYCKFVDAHESPWIMSFTPRLIRLVINPPGGFAKELTGYDRVSIWHSPMPKIVKLPFGICCPKAVKSMRLIRIFINLAVPCRKNEERSLFKTGKN